MGIQLERNHLGIFLTRVYHCLVAAVVYLEAAYFHFVISFWRNVPALIIKFIGCRLYDYPDDFLLMAYFPLLFDFHDLWKSKLCNAPLEVNNNVANIS